MLLIALVLFGWAVVVALVYDRGRGVNRISARVIADSLNPDDDRLTTVEATFNRYILAEVNTHRALSRNSASSRAIPTRKILGRVLSDPAVPVSWGRNQSGMQARSDLGGWRREAARALFLLARYPAVAAAWLLNRVGLHKQITNRIVEPWMWQTAILTGGADGWENLFKLRRHPDAQPEFRDLAEKLRDAMYWSRPTRLEWGSWHLPYTDSDDDIDRPDLVPLDWNLKYPLRALISAARCARVSYVRQGERREPDKDIQMAVNLKNSGHWSPLEHQAQASRPCPGGNLGPGWRQFRKIFPGEDGSTGQGLANANRLTVDTENGRKGDWRL